MPAGKVHRPLQPPWRLLLPDLIGTLLVATGLYELLSPETVLLPDLPAFPYHERAQIAAGLAIMLPAVSGLPAFLARLRRG
jgi:hypothetical protein